VRALHSHIVPAHCYLQNRVLKAHPSGAKKVEIRGCYTGTVRKIRENKFMAQTSAGQVMASVFWDDEGILLMESLKRGATIDSETYVQKLKMLKQQIRRVQTGRQIKSPSSIQP